MTGTLIAIFTLSYFLGHVLFGLLLTRFIGLTHLRLKGSGNIGATNVWRTGNRAVAVLTFLGDAGKAWLAVLIARWLDPSFLGVFCASLGVLLGHIFPIGLRFRGGKGVSTFLGLCWAWSPPLGAFLTGFWGLVFLWSRTASIASLAVCVAATLLFFACFDMRAGAHMGILCLLIVIAHRTNLSRLLQGKELSVQDHATQP